MRNHNALRLFQRSHAHQEPTRNIGQQGLVLSAKTRLVPSQYRFNALENSVTRRRVAGIAASAAVKIIVPDIPKSERIVYVPLGELSPCVVRLEDDPAISGDSVKG